jgi:cadherin EGF LAG seven-pass G-type receptor 1
MVFINISDANTYRPMFQGTPYQVHVDEDKPIGSSIYKVYATDNDVGENARITYSMDDNEAFQIDPITGEIIIKQTLNRETISGYTIAISATDHGRPAQSDSTDVEIAIDDVNDNAPRFTDPEYSGHILEDAFIGTSVLTIQARDADVGLNGRLRYTFEGGNSGAGDFRLDPVLGILRVNKELDRERVAQYELIAYAIDRGTPEQSTSVVIDIQVDDVNDNAPQFQASNLDMFIRENSPIGSTVGTVSAIDPDDGVNAEIEYSIKNDRDGEDFQLSYRPYEAAIITTAIELDYEGARREYVITVRARSFHLFRDTTITIHVQDTNDNVPQLQDFIIIFNNYKDHFPTGEIGRIPAHDPDEYDELKYTFVSGNQANLIHLNKFTGMIRLDPRLNSDVPMNATLQVSVDGE